MAKNPLGTTSSELLSLHFLPTVIVFFTIMILVGFNWRTATRAIIQSETEQVNVRSNYIETNIRQQLAMNDHVLRAGVGLFEASTEVSRQEWKNFVSVMDIAEQLPAMLGLGYVEVVPASRLEQFETSVRAEGFSDFAVTPREPTRPVYTSVKYIEPMNKRNASILGGDMFTEEKRRTAMEHARDSSETSVTDVVKVRLEDNSLHNSIVMYRPLYSRDMAANTAEERRAALQGYVYAPLESDSLFGNIFDKNDKNFNFQIFDGDVMTPETLLYQQQTDQSGEPYRFIKATRLDIDDQSWTVHYGVRDGIVAESLRDRPSSLAFGGTLFAFIVALLVYMLLQRRTRMIASNEEINIQRAKDDLLSLASHQLRTPATGVKQYLGMVLEGFTGKVSTEQRKLLTYAYDSNERQLRIINEFLYMAKADANRIVLSPQRFDLIALTRQTIADMKSEITESAHKVTLKHRAKALYAYADIYSSRMIIENLLSNAIKYTPHKGKITLELKKTGTYATVSVSDNGVGIKKEDFPLLFKQFSRIPNKLTRQTAGSGIGLYLARHLAKLNGGSITVVSEKDAGSTFTVKFLQGNVKKVTVSKLKKK